MLTVHVKTVHSTLSPSGLCVHKSGIRKYRPGSVNDEKRTFTFASAQQSYREVWVPRIGPPISSGSKPHSPIDTKNIWQPNSMTYVNYPTQ